MLANLCTQPKLFISNNNNDNFSVWPEFKLYFLFLWTTLLLTLINIPTSYLQNLTKPSTWTAWFLSKFGWVYVKRQVKFKKYKLFCFLLDVETFLSIFSFRFSFYFVSVVCFLARNYCSQRINSVTLILVHSTWTSGS